ncbi:MAG: GNAT family N-acetyltransferase [Chloroflexia bacterium]|nr:GNAT family N-acetyltransferase [Chloroflexia bacterium]
MHANGHHHEPLPPPTDEATEAYLASVVAAIGDTPETVIALQFLREGTCEVLCVGDPADLEGIVIQSFAMPEEPMAFGSSAEAVASLMPHLSGWTCLNVPPALVDELLVPIGSMAGAPGILLRDDIYHTLTELVNGDLAVGSRLLTQDDHDLIRGASGDMIGDGAARLIDTLQWGHVAGAIRDDALVSLAYTFAVSDRHADIGVVTHPDWRDRGLATAVAACVASAIQAAGQIPVWSCGGPNLASLRIAARLGFTQVSRRVYLIPDLDTDAIGEP